MRFVFAIVSFVIAAVLIAVGVAQRTVFAGPETVDAVAAVETDAPLMVIDGATLNTFAGRQTVRLAGDGALFAAYGRTADVMGWVGDAAYNRIEFDADAGSFVTTFHSGTERTVPNPAGSDLWSVERQQMGSLQFGIAVPEDVSLLIAADGTAPAPGDVSITWPITASKPWSGPLIVGGSAMLLIGLLLLFWSIVHLRRSRGPRRSQPPELEASKPPRGRRFRPRADAAVPPLTSRRASRVAVVAGLTVAAIGLSGCTATDWPEFITGNAPVTATSAPEDGSADAAASEPEAPSVAVTERQAARIVSRIAEVVAKADAELNADLAASRLSGPALALRAANYKARAADSAIAAAAPVIAKDPIRLLLPQQTDTWPRTVFVVTEPAPAEGPEATPPTDTAPGQTPPAETPSAETAESTTVPVALMLVQQDARSPYRVEYAMELFRSVPEVAPPTVGAARLLLDTKLLAIAPQLVGQYYGDVLLNGDQSAHAPQVEITDDQLLAAFGAAKKAERAAKLASENAASTFTEAAGTGQAIALATNDLGALVAIELAETETVKPSTSGSALNSAGAIKALSGKAQSTKGFVATYGMQLLFYVPPLSEDDGKVILLGHSVGLVSASEVN